MDGCPFVLQKSNAYQVTGLLLLRQNASFLKLRKKLVCYTNA